MYRNILEYWGNKYWNTVKYTGIQKSKIKHCSHSSRRGLLRWCSPRSPLRLMIIMIFGWSDQISSTFRSHLLRLMKTQVMMIRPDFLHFLFLFLEIDNNDGGRSDQISSTFCSHFSSTPSTPANQGRRPQDEYLLYFLSCCLSLH